jgi:hypothetical protein
MNREKFSSRMMIKYLFKTFPHLFLRRFFQRRLEAAATDAIDERTEASRAFAWPPADAAGRKGRLGPAGCVGGGALTSFWISPGATATA